MDYESGGAADATTPGRLGLVPAGEGQARRGPPSGTDDLEAFAQAISLQAAARAARFAKGSSEIAGSGGGALHAIGIERGNREIKLGKRASLSPSFDMVLAIVAGVALYAFVIYFILGMDLWPPLPSASMKAAMPPLSATAR
jgi:hypothetical protein